MTTGALAIKRDMVSSGGTNIRRLEDHDQTPSLTHSIFDNTSTMIQTKHSQPFVRLVDREFKIEFSIQGDIPYGWKLIRPLTLTLEVDENRTFIVSDEIFLEYGVGETSTEARLDYIESLIGYYRLLEKRASDDDPETQAQLDHLRQYLQRKNGEGV